MKTRLQVLSRSRNEAGFVLVWSAVGSLALLTVGFIIWQLLVAHQLKLRAINDSVALSFQGSYSAQYPSTESLAAMTLLARAQGFGSAVVANNQHQVFSNGEIQLLHDTSDPGRHSVRAAVGHWKSPLTQLIMSLGQIQASAWSEVRSEQTYFKLAIDNSASLMGDFSTVQTQAFYGVLASATGGRDCSNQGPNGRCVAGRVEPTPYVQTVMPHQFDGDTFRMARRWSLGPTGQEFNSLYPPTSVYPYDPNCINTAETFCGGWPQTGEWALGTRASDTMLAFKNSAGVVLSVLSTLTRLLDVDSFGGRVPDWAVNIANLYRGTNSILPVATTDGVIPIWKFDEPVYSWPDPNNLGAATIYQLHSISNPRNIFTDDIQFYVTNMLQLFLNGKWSRIVANFADVYDDSVPPSLEVPAGTYGQILMPVVPNNPLADWTDSFPYQTSSSTHLPDRFGSMRMYGLPDTPEPLLRVGGEGTPSYLPTGVANQYVYGYSGSTAPYRHETPAVPACVTSGGSVIAGEAPTCPVVSGHTAVVLCHADALEFTQDAVGVNGHGGAFCYPSPSTPVANWAPRCATPGSRATCIANPNSNYLSLAEHRGNLVFPASPQTVKNNAFFAVKDMGLLSGGTWTNTLLRDTYYRLRDLKDQGLQKTALILITDGVPSAVNFGTEYYCDRSSPACYGTNCTLADDCTMGESDTWIMDQVQHWATLISALDTPIYTWYLATSNLLQRHIANNPISVYSGFSAERQTQLQNTLYASPPSPIPPGSGEADCPGPDTSAIDDQQWKGFCNLINNSFIPDYVAQTAKLVLFQSIMDRPQHKRYYIQSDLGIDVSGSPAPGVLFVNGLLSTVARILPRGQLRR
jgi:hypothetical protein